MSELTLEQVNQWQVPDDEVLDILADGLTDQDAANLIDIQEQGDKDELAYAEPEELPEKLLSFDPSDISALISVPSAPTGSARVMANNAVKWAASKVGTTEHPAYSNHVPFWNDVKPEWQGEPWCAAFVTDAWARQGVDLRKFVSNPYYCPSLEAWAKKLGVWQPAGKGWDPRAGDISIMGRGIATHTGLSAPAAGSYSGYRQIEGNTSPSSSGSQTNGNGVYIRVRPDNGFFRGWINMPSAIEKLQAKGLLGRVGSSKPTKSSVGNISFATTMRFVTGPSRGTKNGNIAIMQRALHAQSVSRMSPLDSKWSGKTQIAYQAYQRALGYKGADADGIPGWDSWARLMKWAKFNPVR